MLINITNYYLLSNICIIIKIYNIYYINISEYIPIIFIIYERCYGKQLIYIKFRH